MKKVYFIYSNNEKRDSELVRELHHWLPTHIDILERKIKRGRIVGKNIKAEDKKMPSCLIDAKRPVYLAEDALLELIKIEEYSPFSGFCSDIRAIQFLKTKYENIQEIVCRFLNERKIISGDEAIKEYVAELKRGKFFTF